MDDTLQWAIGAILGILGLYFGRISALHDQKIKKDKELIEKIKNIVPVDCDALQFLRTHDFGNSYRDGQTRPFWNLNRLLKQPDSFFINKDLEEAKKDLGKEINEFQEFVFANIFASDRREDYWELSNPHKIIRERHFYLRSQGKEISEEEENQILQRHKDAIKRLNSLANNICQKYDFLIANAHKTL